MGPGGFAMGWASVWWLLVLIGLVAIVVGLIWAARAGGAGGGRDAHAPPSGPTVSTARQILDERFARGEIDEEEYLARRRTLDG